MTEMKNDLLFDIIDFVDPSITKDEYETVKIMYNSIRSNDINSTNIISQIAVLMKIVASFDKIKNSDKKKLVIFVIKKVVVVNVKDTNEIQMLNLFIDNILPNVIDTMCSIDSGKIIIYQTEQIMNSPCCIPFRV
jgi:hypothetical protein